ncbi:interferon alpha/beta receptor 2 [Xenopus laevis]|uniref:Interferon alpha/beta receptor 2 n=1 Tax=Xenopus laevis TaxID=8355 RepID=A0A8J1M720_XENLA|nr:interferon alpha/beta receptor 2 [Xenopus laevis]
MTGLCLLLLICHLSSSVLAVLRSPENVQIHSVNFQHILTWEDTNNNSLVYYKVQYKTSRLRRWSDVSACVNITKQRCELTDYFTDLNGKYRACVLSFTHNETSNATTSSEFNPISDTDLGPPIVNISAQGRNVTINIHAPKSYFKGTPSMLHDNVYPLMIYVFKRWLNNEKLAEFENVTYKEELTFVESNLPPNTNYCVSIIVSASLNLNGKIIPSALKCVATTADSQPPYVVIVVIVSILILIAIVCVLIGLDRAGYICMGWNFFPKALKSFPTSVSMDGNKEYVCPAQIVSVEILNNTEKEECNDSDEEMCGQGYAARKKFLDSAQNDSISTLQTSAPSSSNESSGQDCSSSAGAEFPRKPLLDLHESCASDLELPQAVTPCPMLINSAGVFNINLNSVSVGNPGDLWTDVKNQAPPIEEQVDIMTLDVPEVPQTPHDLRLVTNISNVGACMGPVSEECSSAESGASDDSDADSGPEEMERPFASDYMSR